MITNSLKMVTKVLLNQLMAHIILIQNRINKRNKIQEVKIHKYTVQIMFGTNKYAPIYYLYLCPINAKGDKNKGISSEI